MSRQMGLAWRLGIALYLWLWLIGALYSVGLIWLWPTQPLRFASNQLQAAVALCILLGLPLLLLSMGRRISHRTGRITFRIIMILALVLAMPFSCGACVKYVWHMQTSIADNRNAEPFDEYLHQLPTKYGMLKVIRHGGPTPNIFPSISVDLDRPVLPGVVYHKVLATIDSAYTAEVRLHGADSAEINAGGKDIYMRLSP